MEADKLQNLIFAVITGVIWNKDLDHKYNKFNIWEYKPGVRLFTEIFIGSSQRFGIYAKNPTEMLNRWLK